MQKNWIEERDKAQVRDMISKRKTKNLAYLLMLVPLLIVVILNFCVSVGKNVPIKSIQS